MWVQSLGWKDPLEKGMATHSSILAWKIARMGSLVGYSSRGHKELDTTKPTRTNKDLSPCSKVENILNTISQLTVGHC